MEATLCQITTFPADEKLNVNGRCCICRKALSVGDEGVWSVRIFSANIHLHLRCPLTIIAGAAFGAVAAPHAIRFALRIVGFGPAGPIPGMLAPAIQSSIGNVPAGHWFALFQSLAMRAALPPVVPIVGAVVGGAVAWFKLWRWG